MLPMHPGRHTDHMLARSDEPRQLHDSVVQRWGWDIVSGALPPGSRIVAEEAAEQLGVSRTVVREAVRVLESMGLITVRRRVGSMGGAVHVRRMRRCGRAAVARREVHAAQRGEQHGGIGREANDARSHLAPLALTSAAGD